MVAFSTARVAYAGPDAWLPAIFTTAAGCRVHRNTIRLDDPPARISELVPEIDCEDVWIDITDHMQFEPRRYSWDVGGCWFVARAQSVEVVGGREIAHFRIGVEGEL
jgi:hypothetical protein